MELLCAAPKRRGTIETRAQVELQKGDTGTFFRRLFPASSFLCSAAPEPEIPDRVQICRH